MLKTLASTANEIASVPCENGITLNQQFGVTTSEGKAQRSFSSSELAQVENVGVQQSDPIVRPGMDAIVRSAITTDPLINFARSENHSLLKQQGVGKEIIQTAGNKDDYLDAAKKTLTVVTDTRAELGTMTEAAVATDTETTSEILAALL